MIQVSIPVKDVSGQNHRDFAIYFSERFPSSDAKEKRHRRRECQSVKADPGALNPMLITGQSDVMISWMTDRVKTNNKPRKQEKS